MPPHPPFPQFEITSVRSNERFAEGAVGPSAAMRVGCFDTIRASTLGQIVEAKITEAVARRRREGLASLGQGHLGALDALDAFHQGQPVLVGLFPTLRQRIEP